MSHSHRPRSKFQKALALCGIAYVVVLLLSHALLPPASVWYVAAGLSIVMNVVYVREAFRAKSFQKLEAFVAVTLISFSVAGAVVHPMFVICAIAGHGVWDVCKHLGVGVPFFRWYTFSCAIVDFVYAAALLVFLFGLDS